MSEKSNIDQSVAGLTPQQWEHRLERAASDPEALKQVLDDLDKEMRQEKTWLHENPSPGKLLSAVFRFMGRDDTDFVNLGKRIDKELDWEKSLKRRYRGWLPGEEALDRIFPYMKDFSGEVTECKDGIQFEGFAKFKGIYKGSKREVFTFYVNDRFPGRDPANFHLLFDPCDRSLVIKRVYRMELPPMPEGPSTARAILAEMTRDICPSLDEIAHLVVDNAANLETRKALIHAEQADDGVTYQLNQGASVSQTPLGHLMLKLADELGMSHSGFSTSVSSFGILEMDLGVSYQAPVSTNEAQ